MAKRPGRLPVNSSPDFDGVDWNRHLPRQVKIVEVGPRDGLQNQRQTVSVQHKVELINRLSDCGFKAIEVGSLVAPKIVPQMADSEIVFNQIDKATEIDYLMLVANDQGLQRAVDCGLKHIAVFCAASEAFSRHNTHCSISDCLNRIESICTEAQAQGMTIRGYISCVLGCPYQGAVDIRQVVNLAQQLDQFGCQEISLGDTIGVGTPAGVRELIALTKEQLPKAKLAVHFHDTYGQALANILTALQSGISIVDSSVSGLGGCPYAPGATGNVASEDVVYMLNGLGIKTNINLDKLIETSWFISSVLHIKPASKVALAKAGNYRNFNAPIHQFR